jgi:putative MATE family efflux protein
MEYANNDFVLDTKRDFFRTVIRIGAPVVIQSVIGSFVNLLSVFMVGQLGEVAITAAAMGNQWFLLYSLLANGIMAAGSIFVAQYWGKKDTKSIHQYIGIMLIGVCILATVFTVFAVVMPHRIISFYSKDAKVIAEGSTYIRIIGISYLMCAISGTFATSLRSIGNTRVPMYATFAALFSNLVLSYVLIFGHFGAPALGVLGAAVSTVIARFIELLVVLSYYQWKKPPIYANITAYFRINIAVIRRYFRYGFFIILGEVTYAIGNNLYNVAYKYTGTEAQAALQITNTFSNLAMVYCGGVATAAAVILGYLLGNNRFEEAKLCCRRLLWMAFIMSSVVGAILALIAPVLLSFFQVGDNTYHYVRIMIYILCAGIPLRTIVFLIIVGVLRSGGDSTYCFFANLIGVWGIGIPLIFIGAVYLELPIYIVYLLALMEELGKFIICFPRVMKYKWIRNIT